MRRGLKPGIVVFVVALVASLGVHLPVYEVLGALAERLLTAAPDAPATGPVEFELAALGDEAPKPVPEDRVEPPAKDEPEVAEPAPEAEPEPDPEPIQERQPPTPQPPPQTVEVEPAPAEPPPPQPPPPSEKLAVTQKSDDPNVEPPPDARFIAEEARKVEEETVANLRNLERDDVPDPGAPRETVEEAPGNSDTSESADLADVKGSDERHPTEAEASDEPLEGALESAGQREALALQSAPMAGGAQASEEVQREIAAGQEQTGGEEQTMLVEDESGSFRIRLTPKGLGAGDEGGAARRGAATPNRQDRAGARAQNGVNLNLSWSQFEQTFGAEELQKQRDAYLAQQRSTAAGGSREQSWRKFRAAIENYVPDVRIGNQTALNAAASPFAAYLAAVHRRIHREYVDRFLANLPLAGGPFDDPTLYTDLEIVWNRDGTLHKVGVLKSSGFLPFDFGAYDAVMRASPFPPPPEKILSGNGKVYVHWAFYRNERQCGTFNARPKIVPNPPGTPAPGGGPFNDRDGAHGALPAPKSGDADAVRASLR